MDKKNILRTRMFSHSPSMQCTNIHRNGGEEAVLTVPVTPSTPWPSPRTWWSCAESSTPGSRYRVCQRSTSKCSLSRRSASIRTTILRGWVWWVWLALLWGEAQLCLPFVHSKKSKEKIKGNIFPMVAYSHPKVPLPSLRWPTTGNLYYPHVTYSGPRVT